MADPPLTVAFSNERLQQPRQMKKPTFNRLAFFILVGLP